MMTYDDNGDDTKMVVREEFGGDGGGDGVLI